jgi:hypothetical protein
MVYVVKEGTEDRDSVTTIWFYAGLEGFGDLHLATEFDKDVVRGNGILLISGVRYGYCF